jgi:hypothetical protein
MMGLLTRRGRSLARQLFGRIESIDVFGVVGLKLTSDNSVRIRRTIQGLIDDYRDEADRSLVKLASKYQLEKKLRRLGDDHIRPLVKGDFRCAIYVQDLVFVEGISQITKYYPDFEEGTPRVVGRWFGHVGRAFRSGASRTDGNVTTDTDRLVDEYGMTPEEAAPSLHGAARQSFSCVLLPTRVSGAQAAIYIDSIVAHAFAAAPADFEAKVRDGAHRVGITEALETVIAEIKEIGLQLDVRLAREP